MSAVTLHHGDALAVLRTLPDASIDACITDPPYGLAEHKPTTIVAAMTAWCSGDREHVPDGRGFMGRAWDGFVPPPAVWDECLRVLKPGGWLLAFAGTRTVDLMGISIRLSGLEIKDAITWHHGQGFPKGKGQLKPASEPIVVARKRAPAPWLNIDGCRVESGDKLVRSSILRVDNEVLGKGLGAGVQDEPAGRWPANVVLTHAPDCADPCVDGCPVAELDTQSGTQRDGVAVNRNRSADNRTSWYGTRASQTGEDVGYGGQGGASRFFPTFRYQAKAPTRERPKVDGVAHPTVKPLALMTWLVRLVTPPGGTVLDPFTGSGTTLQAARDEGFAAVGIEREASYLPLIAHRLGEESGALLVEHVAFDEEVVEPVPVVEPEPAPIDPLLELIAAAPASRAVLKQLRHRHRLVWTDAHNAAARARLADHQDVNG